MKVQILIDTDHPNPDGHAAVAARELFESLTSKPRYHCVIAVNELHDNLRFRRQVKLLRQDGER